MKKIIILFITFLSGAFCGYFYLWYYGGISFSTTNLLENKSIIPSERAKDLNRNYNLLNQNKFSAFQKNIFSFPILIDNARADFDTIFAQSNFAHLVAYPGIKIEKGIPQFTLIFTGLDKNHDFLIKRGGASNDIIIQDTNEPCNPCNPVLPGESGIK